MKIAFSSSFKRVFRKKIKDDKSLQEDFWKCVELFSKNPFDRKLRTHKLKGKLKNLWSFYVEYDVRVIFFFCDNNKKAVFTDIGRHDEVY